MLVSALQLQGFRNLEPTVFRPGARLNVLAGENGHGKTNLLEAIYLVGTLRSFRTSHSADLIRFGEAQAELRARVQQQGTEHLYELRLAGTRKQTRLDGKAPRSALEYFGGLHVVLFAPEDLQLPRWSPAGRQRLLDRAVFNSEPGFLADAQRYARVLKSRNTLLRAGEPDPQLLDAYDAQLLEVGERVISARRRFLDVLQDRFAMAYCRITGTDQTATVAYAGLEPNFAAAFHDARRVDQVRKATTVGPHHDDLDILLEGRPARSFASQGQLRVLILAWKIAEIELLCDIHGEPPVLLLDDVSSELDRQRSTQLFAFLATARCQCFVSTTDARDIPASENRQDFHVVKGQVEAAC